MRGRTHRLGDELQDGDVRPVTSQARAEQMPARYRCRVAEGIRQEFGLHDGDDGRYRQTPGAYPTPRRKAHLPSNQRIDGARRRHRAPRRPNPIGYTAGNAGFFAARRRVGNDGGSQIRRVHKGVHIGM